MGHTRFKGSAVASRQNKPYRFGRKENKLEIVTKEFKGVEGTKDFVAEPTLEELQAKYQELTGEKPHHRMKAEKLKEKIAELEG